MQYFKIPILALMVLMCYSFAINSAQSSEPAYEGSSLSCWLLRDLRAEFGAKEAVRQIGTNGIPTLIEMLGAKNKTRMSVLAKIDCKALKEEFRDKDSNLEDLRSMAVNGFAILGTNAETAVPQLTKLFHNYDETLFQTIRALTKIGPKGISILINAMNDPDESVRNNLISVIGEEGGKDPAITRLLIQALKDPYMINRGNAAKGLAGKSPELVIPALIPLLDDEDYYSRKEAAQALSRFGSASKTAAPKLLAIYTNVLIGKDRKMAFDLGVTVLDSLKGIDQESAGKAEAFLINDGPLGVAGHGWTITRLPSGKELIAGGSIHTSIFAPGNHVTPRAELFDPTTGARMQTGSMIVARYSHVAAMLRNGKVLIAGGSDANNVPLSGAELYDPATGKWSLTGGMNAAHSGNRAAIQKDGKVLIYEGGFNTKNGEWWDGVSRGWDRWVSSKEIYDPTTEMWTIIPINKK